MTGRKPTAWPLPDATTARQEVVARVGEELTARLEAVRLVVLDCDGVLTGGQLLYGPDGEALKAFDARDGLGLMMLWQAGVARAVLTGRTSEMVARRCRDLRFEAIAMGRFDKQEALEEIWRATGTRPDGTLFMGDDLLDLPTLTAAAVAVTVPHAPPEVAAVCDLVTAAPGGSGAVREVCDLLLKARGQHAVAIQALAAGGRPADDPEVTH
jgi:3-deoxy-D-manno-octulosonate 8-phosphate phosphatase (KDO 8-P phosphatase)